MDSSLLKAELFGSLFVLSNRLQLLGDSLDAEVSTKQWFLLAVLCKEPGMQCMLSQLALRMGSSRQNVKKMALILEQKGFLTLEKPEEDRRALLVSPTLRCLEHLKTRERKEQAFLEALYQGFSDEHLGMMQAGFHQWMQNLEVMEQSYTKESTIPPPFGS